MSKVLQSPTAKMGRDGIYVTAQNLGPMFPKGVFIAQDGLDNNGKQNFKLVPWQLIVKE